MRDCAGVAEVKRSKFRAVPVTVDGIRFDSKIEAGRYQSLRIQERLGEIFQLRTHVQFPLFVKGQHIGDYEADFVYFLGPVATSERVIEDVKGVLTPMFRWKAKHMEAQGNPVTLWPPRKKQGRRIKPC